MPEHMWGMAAMVFLWKLGMSAGKQCPVLKEALESAGLTKIAYEYVKRRMMLTGNSPDQFSLRSPSLESDDGLMTL